MNTAFAIFFAIYVVYALAENILRRNSEEERPRPLSLALQAPLFLVALWIAARAGLFNRELFFLPVILLAALAGHVLFTASLLLTDGQLREDLRHLVSVRPIVRFLVDDPNTLFRVFGVSFAEEVIYRVAAQPMFIGWTNVPVGIALAAAAFCVVHGHFFRNPLPQSAEFAIFALVVGAVYWATGDLIAVAMMHAVRNWEIAYLEHVLSQQEDAPQPPVSADPARA